MNDLKAKSDVFRIKGSYPDPQARRRVQLFKNVPAPSNLEGPPHRYAGTPSLFIGEDPES